MRIIKITEQGSTIVVHQPTPAPAKVVARGIIREVGGEGTGGGGGPVEWSEVLNKPLVFTPALHTHNIADVASLQVVLDGKASTAHNHTIGDVTGLQTALNGKQPAGSYASSAHSHVVADVSGLQTILDAKQPAGSYAAATHTHPWPDIQNKPSTFAPSAHTHPWVDITDKPATFAPSVHNHSITDVTGLQVALDSKQPSGSYAPSTHNHTIGDVTGLQPALNGKQPAGSYASASHVHSWPEIVDKPLTFAPAPHNHLVSEITNFPTNITTQGNSFNGTSQLVQLTADGKLPAVDGSLLTNLPAGPAGTGGDFLSTLLSAEVPITGAATATIGKMHVCSGTTADYTVTLPTAVGNAGKFIGFRMLPTLTRMVSLYGLGDDLIDSSTYRKMRASETAILMCDGIGWTKISGKSAPMFCRISLATAGPNAQDVPATTFTRVKFTLTEDDNTGMMSAVGTYRINIIRPGIYDVVGNVSWDGSGGWSADRVFCRIGLNGNENNGTLGGAESNKPAGTYTIQTAVATKTLAANDYITLAVYSSSGGAKLYGDAQCYLFVKEVITW